jgi:hypothetical protein
MRRVLCAGLLAVSLSFPVYADPIDDFLDGPPYPGGLPAALGFLATCHAEHALCQAQLEVFEGEVSSCQQVVADLETQIDTLDAQLSDCLAAVGEFPGDGITGTALNFTDTGNTIFDNLTRFEWAKKNLIAGSPLHRDLIVTYAQAQAHVDALNAAGYEGGGWGLPNLKQLQSIMNYNGPQPIIPDVFGPSVLQPFINYFWSTTPHVQDANQRWLLDGNIGFVTPAPKTNSHRFLMVR